MSLQFKAKVDGPPLPDAFKNKKFYTFVAMANYADEHNLPDGDYWIINDKGTTVLTRVRELRRRGSSFWVERRGHV